MVLRRWPLIMFYTICAMLLIVGPTSAASTLPPTTQPAVADDEPIEPPNDDITPEQEQAMWAEIIANVEMLRGMGRLAAPNIAQAIPLAFPLRMAPGLTDYAGFRVSAFVDHDPTSGHVRDYNGGTRTYDSHRGTDYALYPFNWNKVDAGEVQVIAAAAGTIVAKANVDPTDHNCITSSNDPWNYVALAHADGHMTIYGHMRYNSVTSKAIGQTVALGELLGTAASSGNSSGPHMHFEVRTGGFTNAEWIDPYAGPASQPGSLWSSQRPYMDSAINKLATHSAPPSSPDPCKPTITNLQDNFTTPSNIYFYTYYRDYQGALPTQLAIYRPDGSLFQSSQYAPNNNTFSSLWNNGWMVNFPGNDMPGAWRFEATYNGQTYTTFFNVNLPPTLVLSSPNGAEQWDTLLVHPITWTGNSGGNVNIALYHNGVLLAPVANNTPNDGEYLWIPGLAVTPGAGYTIRVTSALNATVFDQSNAAFTLLPTVLTNREYLPLVQLNP